MAEAEYTLLLDGLVVSAAIGIHPEELAAQQRVTVSVRLDVVYSARPAEDRIEEALDYDFVRREIHALVAARRFNLQETLCEAIAAFCLSDPRVRQVTVRSVKPDIYPDAAIGCEIVRRG